MDSAIARWRFGSSLHLLGGIVYDGLADRARQVASDDEANFGASYSGTPYNTRLWILGVREAVRGDADTAAEVAEELDHRAARSLEWRDRLLASSVGAHVTLARGDTAAAIAQLEQLRARDVTSDAIRWDEAASLGIERLTLARLLAARGQFRRVIDVAGVLDSSWPTSYPPYLGASLRIRARAAAGLGDSALEKAFNARPAALEGAGANLSH